MNFEYQRLSAAEHGSAAISIEGLSKSFSNKPVFSGVSLEIPRGAIVGLLGSNGAGKSTLLRCIPHLVLPDAGTVKINGIEVKSGGRSLRQQRASLGFIFQKHNLVGRASVLTNVVHGARSQNFGIRAWSQFLAPQHVRAEAMHCLSRVGLANLALQRADSLSGGQSQRVAIARALMQKPNIVLADEPAASLDPQAGEDVMRLFSDLMRVEGKTVLFTSHNLTHAFDYADHIIALGEGRVLINAPTNRLNRTELNDIYN